MSSAASVDQLPSEGMGAVRVEPLNTSAVRSHESFGSPVHAVCHHSGQYLMLGETYPQVRTWWRTHHDFPGVPELDEAFAAAAHAANHQHREWNAGAVASTIALASGVGLVVGAASLWRYRQFINADMLDQGIYYAVLAAAVLTAAALLILGMWRITRLDRDFHRRARLTKRTPLVADFPVLHASYEINALEHVRLALGNDPQSVLTAAPPASGLIRIALTPHEVCREHYRAYRACYEPQFGSQLNAGVVALDRAGHVEFAEPADAANGPLLTPGVELAHRLVLRAPVPATMQADAGGRIESILFGAPYTIRAGALLAADDERPQVALSCTPKLNPYDSYMLELHFTWRSAQQQQCFLDTCILEVPPELDQVNRVERGRFDPLKKTVIWRNLAFSASSAARSRDDATPQASYDQTLVLRVAFDRPVIEQPLRIVGSYRCVSDALISGVRITPDHIWDVRGQRLATDDQRTTLAITSGTVIQGDLTVLTRQLSQKHEVSSPRTVVTSLPPDNALLGSVLRALAGSGVEIQQIVQHEPRLDPSGTLQTQLLYWDLIGRRYNEELLNSIDTHVVMAGRSAPGQGQDVHDLCGAQIDIRVRYLYDPRDQTIALVSEPSRGSGASDYAPRHVHDLADRIEQNIRRAVLPASADPQSGRERAVPGG